jgi:phosphate uptake regulator
MEWRFIMRNRFDRELVRLNNELIEMGSMIEKSIETAVKAMVNQDVELANRVIESDDEIDQLEEASVLKDISHMPARVKCAVLGWRTLNEMFKDGK